MRQRDREASAYADDAYAGPVAAPAGEPVGVDEPNDGLFADSLLGEYDFADDDEGRLPNVRRVSRRERGEHDGGGGGAHSSRSARRSRARRRQNRRFMIILAALLVALVAVATWLVVIPLYHYLSPSDYSGSGTTPVLVTIQPDDDAADIGNTLHDQGVVASTRAFTDAASDNDKSQDIEAGAYRLRKHMSAASALTLLLTPSSRINSDVLITEGATVFDVAQRLTAKPCTSSSPATSRCGPGLSADAVAKAFRRAASLGLPREYTVAGKPPSSLEGFLFPATYPVAGTADAAVVLQQMISKFTEQARQTNFTAQAAQLHISPYQELIIASIAEKEAKFTSDYPKVAQVILNRLAAHKPLQIDATSAYGAKVKGLDPTKVIYAQLPSVYNTYTHSGLPPTPIANPGLAAMNGAAHPSGGKDLYYVNSDADGHLAFFDNETAWARAAAKCRANHWGCG